jgi:hypothetical protein
MPNYTFTTPVVEEGPIGDHRLFYFFKMNRGITIIKSSGTYRQVRYILDETLDDYAETYRGGYKYTVNEATKEALIAGNVGITEANFTIQ